MADSTKYIPINDRSLVSDLKLKNIFSFQTKKSRAFAYLFISIFVAVTFFLAFNPSPDPSSPWFSNIFTVSATTNINQQQPNSKDPSSASSQFTSIYSYFFPSNSTLPSSNGTISRSQSDKDPPIGQRNDGGSNRTEIGSPPVQPGSNRTEIGSPSVQLGSNRTVIGSPPVQTGANRTEIGSPASQPGSNQTKIGSPPVQPDSNRTTIGSPPVQPVSNRTAIGSPAYEPGSNRTENGSPPVSPASNRTENGSPAYGPGSNRTTIGSPASEPDNNGSGNENVVKKPGRDEEEGSVARSLGKDGGPKNNVTSFGIEDLVKKLVDCDLYDGEWIRDDSYPLYKPGSCSLIDEQFNCFANGRPDLGFQTFKWKPKGCTLPRLDGIKMLELLRGKRLVFVGDSLNRNMWESLICILRSSIKDQTKVYEASGRHHFRAEASYSFVFQDYNCTVELFVAPFLVQEWETKDKNGTTKETLRLDLISSSADQYKSADVVVFNTGHWWTHDKTAKGQDYYQEGSHVYRELNVLEAFRKAMTTWGMWVDANMNPTKSSVFFRGYSASHFSGGQWNSGGACDHEVEPIKNTTYLTPYPDKMVVLEKVFKGMKTRVSYMNVTRQTDFRKDGHPSIYRKKQYTAAEIKSPLQYQDCSHWCLPGVPDTWNEILYAQLLVKQYQQNQQQKP